MELTPQMIKDFVEKPFAFIERTGLKALILEPRHIKIALPLEGNQGHLGSLYAGALFTVAEIPGGALFLTTFDVSKFYPVVKDMYIRFRRPALSEVTVELRMSQEEVDRIVAEAEKNKKADFVLEAEVKDTTGQVVALSKGVYQLRVHGDSAVTPDSMVETTRSTL